MAPRSSRASGADTDTSMADEPIRQLPVDPMVSSTKSPYLNCPRTFGTITSHSVGGCTDMDH